MAHLIDISAPHIRTNPYPLYAELRKTNPVCQVEPGGWWAVTRYADIQYVLKHPEFFSSAGFRASWLPPWLDQNPLAETMHVTDPPEHTKLRSLVNRAFGPSVVTRLMPHLRTMAEALARRIEPGSEAEFVSKFASPLPAMAIAELLGMDPALHEDFGRWTSSLLEISAATPMIKRESIKANIDEMCRYMYKVIESSKNTPGDDLLSNLVRTEVDGNRLTDREILAFITLLLAAGIDTTKGLLANSIYFLSNAPDVTKILRADPSQIRPFIEEMLRYDGPTECALRLAIATTEVAGVSIPKGAVVACLLSSGNHDESQFPNAEQFDLKRGQQQILTFGHGIHACIGAYLSRCETQIALETLLNRFGGFEPASGEIEWIQGIITRGPATLPIRFLPA